MKSSTRSHAMTVARRFLYPRLNQTTPPSVLRNFLLLTLSVLAFLSGTGTPQAQIQVYPFELRDALESATLDAAGTAGDPLAGGILTVGGIEVIVPRNTLVPFAGITLPWQQIFALAPAPYGLASPTGPQTGLATADTPTPITTYPVHVVGNIVGGSYIAGLVEISTSPLNSGQGVINAIDYANGEMRVCSTPGDPNSCRRVRINDPVIVGTSAGRYSKGLSPDVRFTADQDRPTIRTVTGYPMGLPVKDPAVADDHLRPSTNRPIDPLTNFPQVTFTIPDPTLQAPFEVGDPITYAGTPFNDPAGQILYAHTIIANLGIYTQPGTSPAYVAIDAGGKFALGFTVGEVIDALGRSQFEGFTTDPTRNIHLFGLDVNPITGAATERDWGSVTVGVDGHWSFHPPLGVASLTPLGTLLPATRNVRAAVTTGIPPNDVPGPRPVVANGIVAGLSTAPIFEYLFPEQIVGNPTPPNNFETIPFLSQGLGPLPSAPNVIVGQLNPWPGEVAPPPTTSGWPTPPIANAGPDQAVQSLATVTLSGRESIARPPFTLLWTPPPGVTLSDPAAAVTTFTAPILFGSPPVVLTFSLKVTDAAGAFATVPVTITVNPPPPTLTSITPPSGIAGTSVPVVIAGTNLSGATLNLPAGITATGVTTTATQITATFVIAATAPLGPQSITVTTAGGTSNAVTFTVVYNFTGFFPPVDNLPTFNTVKAGSAIPVKFSLSGNQGLGILAPGYPISLTIACSSTAPLDAIEQTVTAGSSSLTYDATADQYIYTWKTDKAWAGTCRQLDVKLTDGTGHRAKFSFTK